MKILITFTYLVLFPAALLGADTTPFARLKGEIVIEPIGASFVLPKRWVDRHMREDIYSLIHLDAEQLSDVREARGEWHEQFAIIANKALPFDRCIVHAGAANWGRLSASSTPVQMRAYLLAESIGSIRDSMVTNAIGSASGFTKQVDHIRSVHKPWQVDSLRFRLIFHDYGGTACMDYFSMPHDGSTIVFLFMYAQDSRSDRQQREINSIIESFAIRSKAQNTGAPTR